MSKDVAVVVQTHWDREWYYPHQTFLARLLRVMQQVVEQLDSGELKSFLFDGQVSAIEDFYANAEPALVERVRAHVQSGRIVIGPWYIMADEFLCAGESLVRNLELGMNRAAAHGRCQAVGYLPDTFGHIGQMPQILTGFGIDNAVAWRGIDAPQSEVTWLAPDGSRVFTVFLTEGYYQHPFNTEDWRGALNGYLAKIVNRSGGGELLLTQGGDHLLTAENLQQRIEAFNVQQSDFRLSQRTLEEYIRDLQAAHQTEQRPLPEIQGELRDNQTAFVLPDVLSTRQYLKQQNQHLEDRLTGLVEPLLAVAAPDTYPQRYLEQTWQLLIEQHAHDSICGCSVDEVHREMEVRFTQLQQRLDALVEQARLALGMGNDRVIFHRDHQAPSPFADDSLFTLFNPSPKPREGWQILSVFLSGERSSGLVFKTEGGDRLPAIILECESSEEFRSPVDDFPDITSGYHYRVAVQVALAGMQMLPCQVEKINEQGGDSTDDAGRIPSLNTTIENGYYRISVEENRFVIVDKRAGKIHRDALSLVSELDGGDTYNFSPVDATRYRAEVVSSQVVERREGAGQGAVHTMEIALRLRQPAGLDDARKACSEVVESDGVLRLRLLPDDDFIDVQLDWNNKARDQRLRVQFSLGEVVRGAESDSAFHWVQRDKVYSDGTPVSGQQESPVAVFPSYSAVRTGPLGLIHRGLQEAEIVASGGEDRLAMTLVRSVGWLSRRDLKTRGLGAGPDLPTPEAQCLRRHQFNFAFTLRQPDTVTLLQRADSWRRPATLLRGHAGDSHANQSPQVQLRTPALQVSSVRRLERDTGPVLEIRLWNPFEQPLTAEFDGNDFFRTDLAGNILADCRNTALAEVKPYQIATFVFPLAELHSMDSLKEAQHA